MSTSGGKEGSAKTVQEQMAARVPATYYFFPIMLFGLWSCWNVWYRRVPIRRQRLAHSYVSIPEVYDHVPFIGKSSR